VSGFRSVEYQRGIIERKLAKGLHILEILRSSAAPGYSEHHTGRAIDVTTPGSQPLEEEFERTQAFAWLLCHAGEFGFRLSFPRGNPHGVVYEPWHWLHHG
jgi:D-alanyl-D-alanine carboxypeptidase